MLIHAYVITLYFPQVKPYVIYKDGKYEGFCIDIMDALKERLNFEYEVVVSPNNTYGNCKQLSNGTVSCDGMVKMLVDKVQCTCI